MIDRSVPPKISDDIKLHLPLLRKTKFGNGLKVNFVEKNSLPIVILNFIVKSGSIYDPENKSGLANLLGMTIDEGAHGYDALKIDYMLESLGSIFNISVDHDYIYFSLTSLKKNFERSLEIVSWILREPNFTDEDFQREKNKLLSEIVRLKDEPSYVANWALGYYLFEGTPYRLPNIGSSKEVKNITNEDVRKFYAEHFTPSNIEAVAVGNISNDELNDLLNKYFGDWGNVVSPKQLTMNLKKHNPKFVLINKPEAQQSEIRIGNFASERKAPDYFAKKLLNAILGGQFSSRLNHNLREEKGITYGVRTTFSHTKNYGFFNASTAVDTDNTALAVAEFLKEFDLIKKDVTEDEIAFAKSYLKKTYPSQFETYSSVALNLGTQAVFELPDSFYNEYLQNIDAVTKSQILDAAKNNIKTDEQIIIVVGNSEKIKDKLTSSLPDFEFDFHEIQDLKI